MQLELILAESVSARLTLVRAGTTLASKQIAQVKEGNRVLTIVVPNAVGNGKATLRFELTDAAGNRNTLTGKRSVRISRAAG